MSVGEKIKLLREQKGFTQEDLASAIKTTKQTIYKYETGIITNIPLDKLEKIAQLLNVPAAYLAGWDEVRADYDIIEYQVIGSIAAGYGCQPIEEYSDETIAIPTDFIRGHKKEDFFVLTVTGNSMYPQLLPGDKVLVRRTSTVDSGKIAVVLYNEDNATLKRVKYIPGENWVELIPANPEYQTKRIEGVDLKNCLVIGQVVKLIRDVI